MRLVKFNLEVLGETIYINPEQVSCICMSESLDCTYIYVPGTVKPFEVKGNVDEVMERLRSGDD